MNKYTYFLICIIVFTSCATTKITAPTTPSISTAPTASSIYDQAGVSESRLQRIDQMCIDAVESGQVPGIVALISRKGKTVFHKAYGTADESGRVLKKDDIFRIASQTKAITSTAVMMLWEEGHFQLDDPISKYIPEFKNPTVLDTFIVADSSYKTIPADKEITIRHLLNHTSGLGYGVIDGDSRIKKIYADAGITDLYTTEKITIEESVKKLAALPLHHHPGERFTYSEGLDVLGYFIEIISGMPFDQFLRQRIFDPIGMEDTWFYLPEDKANRLVKVQEPVDGKWKNFPATFYDPDYPIKGAKTFFSGGAGLSSTASDYAKFLQMYLDSGTANGYRLLSRTTVRSIMGNQIGNLWGDNGSYYGLAFGVVDKHGEALGGQGSEGTFSWGGYFNTQYFADPKEEVLGVIMKNTQRTTKDETGWKFRQMVFQIIND